MSTTKVRHVPASEAPEVGAWRRAVWARSMSSAVLMTAFALASAFVTPRGPITAVQALLSLFFAIAVGGLAGGVVGSRWTILAAPLLYAAVFEVARIGTVGPTVDQVRLSSTYGVIAFVVGRLVHGVIVLGPLALGAALGSEVAARRNGRRTWGFGGRVIVTAAGLATMALAVMLARPASTAPILDPDGEPLAGSVAELTTVEIGGRDQVLMIRGRRADNPVLLYLAGGPGGTDLGAMRIDTALESDFVVATWDQRGTGKSYPAIDSVETLTMDQMVADTVEVTEYLRDRFGRDRVYLVGNSWGSLLGVHAVSERPDLFSAYVGIGQMVSPRETDVMFWTDALEWAGETGDDALVETLRRNGPPPYSDLVDYEAAVGTEHLWNEYPELDLSNEMPAILFVPEYDLMEKLNGFRGFLDTFSVLYPQLQDVDLRRDMDRLDVPVFMITGEHEARGRAVLAFEWFDELDAPFKDSIVFEGAGHRAHFDAPDSFSELMSGVAARSEYPGG